MTEPIRSLVVISNLWLASYRIASPAEPDEVGDFGPLRLDGLTAKPGSASLRTYTFDGAQSRPEQSGQEAPEHDQKKVNRAGFFLRQRAPRDS